MHPSRPAHTASCIVGTGTLSWEESGRGVVVLRLKNMKFKKE